MDQVKIGQFIKEKRKEKNLTQQELADLVGVSFKTISKWECGNGLPEVSLMMPLCEKLDISVNELLLGEVIEKENYMEKSEEIIIKLKKENEKKNKFNLILEQVILAIAILLVLGSSFLPLVINEVWISITIICVSTLILIGAVILAFYIEKESICYVCPNCGKKINCSWKIIVCSTHAGWDRKFRCPSCHQRSWMKKRLDRE